MRIWIYMHIYGYVCVRRLILICASTFGHQFMAEIVLDESDWFDTMITLCIFHLCWSYFPPLLIIFLTSFDDISPSPPLLVIFLPGDVTICSCVLLDALTNTQNQQPWQLFGCRSFWIGDIDWIETLPERGELKFTDLRNDEDNKINKVHLFVIILYFFERKIFKTILKIVKRRISICSV